jgi:hypothetical protein
LMLFFYYTLVIGSETYLPYEFNFFIYWKDEKLWKYF